MSEILSAIVRSCPDQRGIFSFVQLYIRLPISTSFKKDSHFSTRFFPLMSWYLSKTNVSTYSITALGARRELSRCKSRKRVLALSNSLMIFPFSALSFSALSFSFSFSALSFPFSALSFSFSALSFLFSALSFSFSALSFSFSALSFSFSALSATKLKLFL
jgi:hypothetical protein